MERNIRVLVADRLKLMREVIIATLSDQPDIEIVGEVQEQSDLIKRVEETKPDFVFIGMDNPELGSAVCNNLLRTHPGLNIIALGAHSNRSIYYWASFRIHSRPFESSEEAILDAVRRRNEFSRMPS